jgi:hypothetical protein
VGRGETVETRVLRADARFTRLPRPDYDIDAHGIRPGTASVLSVLGGLLLIAAPGGAWLRVTRLASDGAALEVVQEVAGWELTGGGFLVGLGLAALAGPLLWPRRSRWPRRVAHVTGIAAALTVAVLLLRLQSGIDAAALAAVEQAGFYDLVPGPGWGAWAAIVGVAVLAAASLLALLSDPPAAPEVSSP